MQLAAGQMLSVTAMEHYITSNNYTKAGKLPNNFKSTLPHNMSAAALRVFKVEYLFDFMLIDDADEERVIEDAVKGITKEMQGILPDASALKKLLIN